MRLGRGAVTMAACACIACAHALLVHGSCMAHALHRQDAHSCPRTLTAALSPAHSHRRRDGTELEVVVAGPEGVQYRALPVAAAAADSAGAGGADVDSLSPSLVTAVGSLTSSQLEALIAHAQAIRALNPSADSRHSGDEAESVVANSWRALTLGTESADSRHRGHGAESVVANRRRALTHGIEEMRQRAW